MAKEESFEEIIRDLTQRLKDAETRASEGKFERKKRRRRRRKMRKIRRAWKCKSWRRNIAREISGRC